MKNYFIEDDFLEEDFIEKNKKRALRRHNNFKKAERKRKVREGIGYPKIKHKTTEFGLLNKGKIHCSCSMCQRFRAECAEAKWKPLKKQAEKDIKEYYKGRY